MPLLYADIHSLLVRLVAGPSCDRYGPRKTFVGCLLIGAIPTALAGTCYNKSQLMACRFFVGILGGSFVPCQVWSTGFFDKNIVGASNALTGGLGNSGGGITYFLMPAIFDSLVHSQGLSMHTAWRVTFIVPFIVITFIAISMLLLCPDTPTGHWRDRHLAAEQNLAQHGITGGVTGDIVPVTGNITDKASPAAENGTSTPTSDEKHHNDQHHGSDEEKLQFEAKPRQGSFTGEAQLSEQQMLDTARGEVVVKPSFSEAMRVIFSPQTLVTAGCYFCSFGAELSINSVLGMYYLKNFKSLGQTGSGQWAAMFGILNCVFRPIGGFVSDYLYRKTGTVWSKKIFLHCMAVVQGVFLIAIGATDPNSKSQMFGLVAGLAFFLEGCNGANYSLVPHVHPTANGKS